MRTILVNSNPATIMTDPTVADAVYLEPLTVPAIEAVIARERPEGLLAGLGGQTALNLAMALSEAGVLERHNVRLLGTPLEAIRMAEDREAFRDLLDRIDQPYAPSFDRRGARTTSARHASAEEALAEIGLPAIIRPAFTLGGTGGGIVETEDAYWERVRAGLRASPIKQVMIERCLVGWQEIEYEVMRDAEDTCIAVCSMENVDPLGVHTGDSIVVAPVQTLTDQVHQRLRSAALAIIRALGVEGGCNVQFALSPDSTEYAVIEVNPRVSRSSALASKATGYPIARVAAQIAAGRTLAEIPNVVTGTTVAAFEPALDYVVVKLPRFPFDKFPDGGPAARVADEGDRRGDGHRPHVRGGAQQGAPRPRAGGRGAAGRGPVAGSPTFDYLAAVYAGAGRGGGDPLEPTGEDTRHPLGRRARRGVREHAVRAALRGADRPAAVRRAVRLAAVAGARPAPPRRAPGGRSGRRPGSARGSSRRWAATSRLEHDVRAAGATGWSTPTDADGAALLATAKRAAFADRDLGGLAGVPGGGGPRGRGRRWASRPATRWSTRAPRSSPPRRRTSTRPTRPPARRPRRRPAPRPAALVIGSGPVRIGQGIEFDYCAVQAADVLRRAGWSAVMVNSNPETVSTDFDASHAAVLRAARRRERPEHHRVRERRPAGRRRP